MDSFLTSHHGALAQLPLEIQVPPVSNFVVDAPDGFDPTAPLAADANPIEAYKLAATFARLEVERVWVRAVFIGDGVSGGWVVWS